MISTELSVGKGERVLVRKMVDKNQLSSEHFRVLLLDATTHLDPAVGNNLTPGAAGSLVDEDLLPALLGMERSPLRVGSQ
jgi:hypothetical protein